ncbi:ribonuclease P (protein C5) [Williamsoniiplasma luminosum]|uniref:Ribonuclease P protein component n=1 Tax=Williamsoniiplasma luminosum TaxID=214888 RepID=A0A2K8NUP8_9MOLU|nr:ribonuclease P protein component [Williamsoniiplasma luminosum]ATZ16888.1 ribonuclease P (protein C5) [Williamsoniiplasma luminosum]AVP49556.1 MAG: ribonuclease P protein component [Williamsoniiplasma luminosum]
MKNKRIIKKNFEFQEIIKQNHVLKNSSFVVYFQKTNEPKLEFGISVGKKIGNAVVRNQVKRQIRMQIFNLLPEFGALNFKIIIIARPVFLKTKYEQNNNELNKILTRIKKINN